MSIDWLGYIAALLTSLSFLPQAVKVIKTRDTRSLSLTMYSMFTIGVALWLIYGVMRDDLPIILANFFTLTLASIILLIKFLNRNSDKKDA